MMPDRISGRLLVPAHAGCDSGGAAGRDPQALLPAHVGLTPASDLYWPGSRKLFPAQVEMIQGSGQTGLAPSRGNPCHQGMPILSTRQAQEKRRCLAPERLATNVDRIMVAEPNGTYSGAVLTVGVDLAAADKRTAMATVEWLPGRAVVRDLVLGVSDAQIVEASRHWDKTGLDCPLGWPAPFVALVTAHQAGHIAAVDGEGGPSRRPLAYRQTDEVVRRQTGIIPLSVAADRIGHAAFRCAGLLSMLAADGQDVDRCGDGRIVEVYPAAALSCWSLTHRGYKGRRQQVQHADLVTALCAAAPWLELGAFEALARRSHDAFDAVVASLAARAAAIGKATAPDDKQRVTARSEGWIALPTAPLSGLIDAAEA